MIRIEDLLDVSLTQASRVAADELLPDVATALDRLMPLVMAGDRMAVRRYVSYVEEAVGAFMALPYAGSAPLPPSGPMGALLMRHVFELPWVAPSLRGSDILSVLVDRLRGLAAGHPQEYALMPLDIDIYQFSRFEKMVTEAMIERELSSPLRRAMATLDLGPSDVAGFMGVSRQAVEKWLLVGPPTDRLGKIGAVVAVADILRHRLKEGLPAAVARRPADAYGGRTMLEVIADDEQEWLLASVRESFDFASVA